MERDPPQAGAAAGAGASEQAVPGLAGTGVNVWA